MEVTWIDLHKNYHLLGFHTMIDEFLISYDSCPLCVWAHNYKKFPQAYRWDIEVQEEINTFFLVGLFVANHVCYHIIGRFI